MDGLLRKVIIRDFIFSNTNDYRSGFKCLYIEPLKIKCPLRSTAQRKPANPAPITATDCPIKPPKSLV